MVKKVFCAMSQFPVNNFKLGEHGIADVTVLASAVTYINQLSATSNKT